MHALRRLIRHHRALAAALVALALAAKLMLPVGYMPVLAGGHIVVSICSGIGATTMTMPLPGSDRPDEGAGHGKAEAPCAFAGLSAPSLAAADPLVLALAIAFVLALGRHLAPAPAPVATPYLRPPLRGPPLRH